MNREKGEITWEELGLPSPAPGSKEAMAENPGKVRIHYLHYFLCYPTASLVVGGLIALFVVAALLWHWGFWVGAALFLALFFMLWNSHRWQGLYGELNPGMVVATKPYLVAVLTDLSVDGSYWPTIKVVQQPLGRMTGGPPEIGTRLATVALYSQLNEATMRWEYFLPEVVNCMTTDEEVIARVLATIPDYGWEELQEGVKLLPRPLVPGMFPLEKVAGDRMENP